MQNKNNYLNKGLINYCVLRIITFEPETSASHPKKAVQVPSRRDKSLSLQ